MTLHTLSQNAALAAASGNDPTFFAINQYGRNPSCDNGADEEIWNGSVVYSNPATALMTKLSQTADQAALRGATVHIKGLDANWNLVEQDVLLDASDTTTHVVLATLGTPLLRVYYAEIHGTVASTSSVRLHNDAEDTDYFVMPTGNNSTALAWYTVPAGHTAYMTNWWAQHNPKTGNNFTSNLMRIWTKDNVDGSARITRAQNGIAENGRFQHYYTPYMKFTEKTDIQITSSPVGAAADISAGFDLIVTKP